MNYLVRLKRLKQLRKKYADIAQNLGPMSLIELRTFRTELIKTLYKLNAWKSALKFGQRQLPDEDKRFLEIFHDEVDRLEIEVSNLIMEKEQEYSLHELWEAELLPEPIIGERITPKYPALASYECPDLISLMDDSWLPVDRPGDVRPLSVGVVR
jgi:hypothetical protein